MNAVSSVFDFISVSFPRPQKPLHHIILRCVPRKLYRAVLLDDLVYLHPAVIGLFHVRLAHGDIRGSDSRPCGRVLCKKPRRGNNLLTLNPSGHAHGILLHHLDSDQPVTVPCLQPVIRFTVDFLRHQLTAAFLRRFQKIFHGRHIHAFQLRRLHQDFRRAPLTDFFRERLWLPACARPCTAAVTAVLCHCFHPRFFDFL